MRHSQLALTVAVVALPAAAQALPRFAARNAMQCVQCHINPTGGGMRNRYGRNVFEQTFLPWSAAVEPKNWLAPTAGTDETAGDDGAATRRTFSPDLTEFLAVGADLRAGYIFIRPDRRPDPDSERQITNSFFLMQADLYHAAEVNEHVTMVLDVGVYSGFEAWGLLHWGGEQSHVYVKVGRFLPPFGIREVEHQLFTREGIGLGATDRDTGVELTGLLGPLTLHVALLNGTLGDRAFDATGTERRVFEKAVATQISGRAVLGPLRGQLGASYYFNQNINQTNPLFGTALASSQQPLVSEGVDETRADLFITLNLGRFTYLGELAAVRDRFSHNDLPTLTGYASYQELSLAVRQGLDLVVTYEFAEPDTEILKDAAQRAGVVWEFFPWPYTEVRLMGRRLWSDSSPTGGVYDVVLFLHLFM